MLPSIEVARWEHAPPPQHRSINMGNPLPLPPKSGQTSSIFTFPLQAQLPSGLGTYFHDVWPNVPLAEELLHYKMPPTSLCNSLQQITSITCPQFKRCNALQQFYVSGFRCRQSKWTGSPIAMGIATTGTALATYDTDQIPVEFIYVIRCDRLQ